MLVYGDRSRRVGPRALLNAISEAVARAGQDEVAWRRQDALRAVLIAAGELAQGIADAEFEALGRDDDTPMQGAAMGLAVAMARLFADALAGRDECSGFGALPQIAELLAMDLPATITCKAAEGYAFYAVYPESYLAAVAARSWDPPPAVIGLRSIGTSLAAVAAAATGADLVVTLRPCGDPYRREVRASARLRERLAAHRGEFLIVDEGPGLSGSSFAAAAGLLEDLRVEPGRIVFAPSHGGDLGPRATPPARARWQGARRVVSTLDELLAAEPIAGWFADLIGEARRVEDISGGRWARDFPPGARPPVWAAQERRKFRIETGSGVYVARFAGLGRVGAVKFEQASALHAAGFVPEPLAYRRGFLLERWETGAPIDLAGDERPRLLEHLARYLAFRARRFPAERDEGATWAELMEMAKANASALGGERLGEAVRARLAGFDAAGAGLRPVRIDGRLHAWEWLRRADGRPTKADALDHAGGHDLIGCQDIGWDIAGAALEWRLSEAEVEGLVDAVSRLGAGAVSPAAVEAFSICYAAFQAALWTMAAQGAVGSERDAAMAWRDARLADLRRLVGDNVH